MREVGLTDNGHGGIPWSVRKGRVRTYPKASGCSLARLARTVNNWSDAGRMRIKYAGPGYSWFAQEIA